jgi:hypothetical protein
MKLTVWHKEITYSSLTAEQMGIKGQLLNIKS